MISRKVRPLLAVAGLGCVVLIANLYRVQVHQHVVWAGEASRLVHSGNILPYRRGSILDASGQVLVRDKSTYSLSLSYRTFRRGHPLGQVAHARSLLLRRAVSLQEARYDLPRWTLELLSLRPIDLDAFAEGAPLALGSERIPATSKPQLENRSRRAGDVRYYLRRMLLLDAREWKRLESAAAESPQRSFLELAVRLKDTELFGAGLRDGESVAAAGDPVERGWRRIEHRLARSIDYLARFAALLERAETRQRTTGTALDGLVEELEETRRAVEDATASKLFAEATGFAPGRIAPDTLAHAFDLGWIARTLAWDERRLEEWTVSARTDWLSGWRDGYALPRLFAQLRLDPARDPQPDDVLDRIAAIFAPEGEDGGDVERLLDNRPAPWRASDRLAVLHDLQTFLEVPMTPEVRARRGEVLASQDPEVRAFQAGHRHPWALLDRVLTVLPDEPELGAAFRRHVGRGTRRDAEALDALARRLADDWEARFQGELAAVLALLSKEALPDTERTADGRLVFSSGVRERAVERADFFLKDFGMRPRPLQQRPPDYEVVGLLTRFEAWYPGLRALEVNQRVATVFEEDDGPLFEGLIGHVGAVDVDDLLRQRPAAQRLEHLRGLADRSSGEEHELEGLVSTVLRSDEQQGVSGIEGFWDVELRGENGYRERWGLQDVYESRGHASVNEPVDGQDVVLTMDLDVQRDARDTLRHPERVNDPDLDLEWFEEPVGAIVFLSVEGDVVAAASEPGPGSVIAADASGQRGLAIERTLRQPTFQPPGSVFKPFVAAWALEHLGLDPERRVFCGEIARGGSGYKDVRCWKKFGHGEVNLKEALIGSCNAYFAELGERYPVASFYDLAYAFGFGEPTGVRTPPPWNPSTVRRGGLIEAVPAIFAVNPFGDFERRLAGNGLAVIDATPMQVARATLALATGEKRSCRLVSRIGELDVPYPAAEPIPIAAGHLERVRDALRHVAADRDGTAYKALNEDQLGFAVAAKTGSADLTSRRDGKGDLVVRKHTWVAGWVPAVDPVAVFVIFVHDTRTTSSHGAVYVARQFLLQDAVRSWLGQRGVSLREPSR